MVSSPIPNVTQKRRILAGTEAVRGTAVTPEFKLYGAMQINRRTPLQDREEYAGTYDVDYTPVYGPAEIDGTYAVPLSYEDLALLPRYAVGAAPTPTSDAETVPGFTYLYEPSPSTDDIESATVLYGWDGMIWRSTMLMFPEFTIRADVDDAAAAWQWESRVFARSKALQIAVEEVALTGATSTVLTVSGAAWTIDAFIGQYVTIMSDTAGAANQVRLITDNDATTITVGVAFDPAPGVGDTIEVSSEFTSGISDRDRDVIDAKPTRLYVEDEGGTIGTTTIRGFKAFSVTVNQNIAGKRFMEDTEDYSDKLDRGIRRVTAQFTVEFDSWREYARWEEQATRIVRIEKQNGPIIDSGAGTRKSARIDLPAMYYEVVDEQVRNNNILATFGGRGFVDPTEGYSFAILAKNALSVLPGD
jgi:hypothetical protein